MDTEEMRSLAEMMIQEGVIGADPEVLVKENVELDGDTIRIGGNSYSKRDYDEIVIFGIGKAAVGMACGLKKLDADDGLIITNRVMGREKSSCPVPIREAEHPYPEEANMKAAKELLQKLKKKKNALIIFLVSGGGSALFFSPIQGVSVREMNELNRSLVKSGANIHEINAVRKHLSRIKGGKFAELCREKGELVSLIISDVVGDDLSVIASGPTYPDSSTFEDAVDVLQRYQLWENISKSIKDHLKRGVKGELKETPKKLDVNNHLVGNNLTALKEAERAAEKEGLNTIILTSQNKGEAKEVAKPLMGIAKEIQDTCNPLKPPAAVIVGGETTVSFEDLESKSGKGGPNREMVLSAAREIENRDNIVIASADSDGIDGVDKAGAVADCKSADRSSYDVKEALAGHDSQTFFEDLNDNLDLESSTNVNDVTVILVEEKYE
ncbi:MAG: DUF4147 domain-containing protein [Candidatus Thermoplasmatota archaeon]